MFEGELNKEALDQSFASLIDRHESLRTVFVEKDDGVVEQVIKKSEESGFRIGYNDMRGEENREERWQSAVAQQMIIPFDLSAGPLLRANIYQTEDNKWMFAYVIHHIISDGWSMGILIKELLHFYKSFVTGETSQLKPLRIQYRDYAAWQQKHLLQSSIAESRAYWLSKLSGNPEAPIFPADFPRPLIKTYNGSTVPFTISKEDTTELKALGRKNGVTLFMTLVGIIKVLLLRYTGQEDCIIGTPVAGRGHTDLENQIGFYVNTLVLRDSIQGSDDFSDVFAKVKKTILEAQEYQQYPFDKLVEELGVKRELNRNPLFEIMAVLQNEAMQESETSVSAGGLTIKNVQNEYYTSRFDINFDMKESFSGISVLLEYNTDLYERASVLLLRDRFLQLVNICLNDIHKPVNEMRFEDMMQEQKEAQGWEVDF